MKYTKPEINTVGLASDAIGSVFKKSFEFLLDVFIFTSVSAYEADE